LEELKLTTPDGPGNISWQPNPSDGSY